MDRQIVYSGAIPLETDLLKTNQNTMIAIAKLASAMFGSSTIVNGLTVTAQSPAAMAVNVSAGEIYELANLEATAYSSLAADTTHSIMKQGVSLNTQALTIATPGTVGYSINYLIQATYQDSDSNAATLPYYNSANPSQAWSGPSNSGTQQYTTRSGAVVVSAKAGVAAMTGSQSTPSPDSGYVGLYVVTVAYGASTITSGNISQYSGAPLLLSGLLQSIQNGNTSFATDTGVANAYVCNFTPAITARNEGIPLRFKVANTNTGASTFNDGIGVSPLVGGAHSALQGGELVAGGDAWVQWNSTIGAGSYVLLFCTGAPEQVAIGSKSQHAATFAQVGSFSKANYLSVNTTLTAANAGQLIVVNAAATTQTLPLSSTCPSGTKIGFYGFNTGNTTIIIQGSDTIDAGSTSSITSFVMESGGYIEFTSSAGGLWMAAGVSALKYSANFAATKATNGSVTHPSGIVFKWGQVTTSSSATTSVTFPVAFPNACFGVLPVASTTSPITATQNNFTSTGCNFDTWTTAGARSSTSCNWQAIGY
jgi:hypothetical protein